MHPCLSSGDFVLVNKRKHPKVNQIAVVNHPKLGVIIKRVSHFDNQGNMQLKGDSLQSTTAESMGLVSPDLLIGTVIFSVRKRG